MIRNLTFAAGLLLSIAPAWADEIKVGDLTIDNVWSRATPKGAEVGVGYLTIHNNGATEDRLMGGGADFAAVQVHDMSQANGVMKMREITDGIAIPAHGAVTLGPNSYHLMFVGLKQPLVKGQPFKATLTFQKAGSVEVHFDVRGFGAGAMGGMKM